MVRKVLSLVFALTFVVSVAFADEGFETYPVKKDDTLASIIEGTLKSDKFFPQLLAYNQITHPKQIVRGETQLKVPFSISKNRFAKVTMTVGNVNVKRANGAVEPMKTGSTLLKNDAIITAAGSRAEVQLDEGSVVRVGPETEFALASYGYGANGARDTNLNLANGSMSMRVTKLTGSSDFKVSTVTAVAGVRGTFFYVNYDKNSKEVGIAVYSGKVEVGKEDKNGKIEANDKVAVSAGHATKISAEGKASPVFKIPGKIEWAD